MTLGAGSIPPRRPNLCLVGKAGHHGSRRSRQRELPRKARGLGLLASVLVLGVLAATTHTQSGSRPDRPARGNWDFNPKKVWEISRVGDQPLAAPAELRVSPGGGVYFHDFERHLSYACDTHGRLVRAFAGQGQRPGEVSRYMNCLAGDERVVILSPESLHFYTGAGEYIRSVPNDLFQRFPFLYLGGETFLFGPGALTQVPGTEARIDRTDVGKGESAEFARVSVSDQDRQGPPGAIVLGLTPQLVVARDPTDGTLYYGKNSEYRIHAVDAEGRALATFGLARARAMVTEADKRAHFAGRGIPADRVEKMVATLPDQAVHYHRIEVHRSLVYVYAAAAFGGSLTRQPIDVFSRSGEYLYQGIIAIEEGRHVYGSPDNLRVQGDQLYVILEDGAGRRTIAKYGIQLPGRSY